MKTFINTITLIFAVTFVAIAADNYINSLSATSDGKQVTLSWTTMDEDGIKLFEAERAGNTGQFVYIGEEKPNGTPSTYELIDDDDLMKEADGNDANLNHNEYTYRIKIVKHNGSYEFSNTASVTHNTSSMRKTWGMIKEMFR